MIKARFIAFYLPQFHSVPENDRWWGRGFTEWTNVRNAEPLYEGHEQPRTPGELGYYDLLDDKVVARQCELAVDHGVEAFCYYHYWFAGRRLLEKPLEHRLASRGPDMPFCLCWANESWTGIWHGAPDRVLMEQSYPGADDHARHFESLLPAFCDDRYLKVDSRPLFVVYKPYTIPDRERWMEGWNNLAVKNGLPGIFFIGVRAWGLDWDPVENGYDGCVPLRMPPYPSPGVVPKVVQGFEGRVIRYDHDRIVDHLVAPIEPGGVDFPCIAPNWDNTPRCGYQGIVVGGSRPALFARNVESAMDRVAGRPPDRRLVFIKSWNEWAEGNYLEPDTRHGRGYLETLRESNSR